MKKKKKEKDNDKKRKSFFSQKEKGPIITIKTSLKSILKDYKINHKSRNNNFCRNICIDSNKGEKQCRSIVFT